MDGVSDDKGSLYFIAVYIIRPGTNVVYAYIHPLDKVTIAQRSSHELVARQCNSQRRRALRFLLSQYKCVIRLRRDVIMFYNHKGLACFYHLLMTIISLQFCSL